MLPQPKTNQPAYLIAGVLFTLIAIAALAALLVVKSKADPVDQQIGVTNADPVVDSVSVSDTSQGSHLGPAGVGAGFTPNEGTTRKIYVYGQLTDPNGCQNLDHAFISIYRSGSTNCSNFAPDTNDCYQIDLPFSEFVGCDGPLDTTVTFETDFDAVNFIDPTDNGPYAGNTWIAEVVAVDDGEHGDTETVDFEVNSLIAFSVPSSINYGTVGLGLDSSAIGLTFSNTGNREVDSDVIALVDPGALPTPLVGDMTSNMSGFDNISASAVHYSLTSGFTYGTGDTAVSKTASTNLALALEQQVSDGDIPTTDTYWRLRMPGQGVNGTYTNVIQFTAKVAAEVVPTMAELGSLDYSSSGGAEQIFEMGDTVVMTNDTLSSLKAISTIDPENPSQVGALPIMSSNVTSLVVYNSYIYLGSEDATNNFQIRNALNGQEMSTITVSGGIKDIAVLGNYAYVLVGDNDIEVINVTSKSSPLVVVGATLTLANLVEGIKSDGANIFVYSNEPPASPSPRHGYIDVLNVSTPDSPTIIETFQTYPDAKMDLEENSDYAYVAGNNSDFSNTLQVISIATPSNLSALGSYSINDSNVISITVSDGMVVVADSSDNVAANLHQLDASNPETITVEASALVGSVGTFFRVVSTPEYVYVADKTNGFFRVYAKVLPVVIPPPGDGK